MDRDLTNFKKWFQHIGLEMDVKIDDEVLKKLIPPQRRDMWRHVIKYVRPKDEVDLIKKSLLLHKLHNRQKPLLAKVESDVDLANALKYEDLITKYNKIQKEIIDAKINNSKLEKDLNEKVEHKKNIINNIEFKQNTSYLAKHKIEDYNKFVQMFNKLSINCNHFSRESNTDLTKADFEDALIICFAEVDDAKESGVMNESVNVGKNLCNAIYTAISDKSPAVLIQTVEENITKSINSIKEIILKSKETVEYENDNKIAYGEIIEKLLKMQLELESNLSNSLSEKEHALENLKKTTSLVKNEIINQYKLKNLSCTDDELQMFKKNLKESFYIWYKKSFECSKITAFQENVTFENETFKAIDEIERKSNILNEEINQKQIFVSEMLKEFSNKDSNFGLMEIKAVMNNLANNYLNTINYSDLINKTVNSIKASAVCDVKNMNKLAIPSTPRSSIIHSWTLKDMKQHSAIIDIICEKATKFEQFDKLVFTENSFDIIIQKENVHESEFKSIISQIEDNILELNLCIDDSKLVVNILLTKEFLNSISKDIIT